jgi:hypothetical protein
MKSMKHVSFGIVSKLVVNSHYHDGDSHKFPFFNNFYFKIFEKWCVQPIVYFFLPFLNFMTKNGFWY